MREILNKYINIYVNSKPR